MNNEIINMFFAKQISNILFRCYLDMLPISPIYVTFNINPNQPDGAGFVMDQTTGRTHNVVATLPDYDSYSPLWYVNVYDVLERKVATLVNQTHTWKIHQNF